MLGSTQWGVMHTMTVDDAADFVTRTIKHAMERYIPHRHLQATKSSHPWLDHEIKKKVSEISGLTDGDLRKKAMAACSDMIVAKHKSFVERTKAKLAKMKRGSKAWWAKSKELQRLVIKTAGVAALKNKAGKWITTSVEKADLLSKTWQRKCELPDATLNRFTHVHVSEYKQERPHILTESDAYNILRKLNESSGPGPDAIPTKVLKRCAAQLANAVLILANLIKRQGSWPTEWKKHWLMPIFKKSAVFLV